MTSNGGMGAEFVIETLESRQLLAATVTPLTSEPSQPFIAKINFQPNSAAVPSGYVKDTGSVYGNRGNGLTYGWSSSNNKTSDRNNSLSPDQRYDTLNRIQSSSLTWQLAVPNGRYVVKLVSGDPVKYDGYYHTEVEGRVIVDGDPSSTNRWIYGTATVDVSDGKLTLRNASGAANNKVNFIEVYQTDLPTVVTIASENSGGFTRSGPADFLLRPSGDPSNIAKVEFFSGTTKLGEDTAAPFGLVYGNVDPGTYSITTRVTSKSGGVTTSQPVPLTVRESVVSWMTIGGSSTNTADRQVGWNIKSAGWQGFVDTIIKPQIAWGAKRIVLHNPFGTLPGEDMQFDQFLHAKDAKLNWLTQGFVEAWKPITDSGIEVICYLGSIAADADFSGSNWERRFWDSVRPALDAGMSVALDSSASTPAGSRTHLAAQMLGSLGVEVYVEARPAVGNTHWHNHPVICVDSFWDRSDPDRYPDAKIWASNSMLRGEILRVVITSPTKQTLSDNGWLGPYAKDVIGDGHTAATPVWYLIRDGVSLEDLFA